MLSIRPRRMAKWSCFVTAVGPVFLAFASQWLAADDQAELGRDYQRHVRPAVA
jgi:hypothetical protein